MFGNKKNNQFAKGGHTLFDRALEIRGTVTFGGTLDIEGRVIGDVIAAEGSDALVRLRSQGTVEGEIRAPKVNINGTVIGDIYAGKHLELAANAVVNGNVNYSVIEMVKGAQVNGNLIHIEDEKEQKSSKSHKVESVKSSAATQSADPSAVQNVAEH